MRRTGAIVARVVCAKTIEFNFPNPVEIRISEKENLLNSSNFLPLVLAAALTRTRGVLTRSPCHRQPGELGIESRIQ